MIDISVSPFEVFAGTFPEVTDTYRALKSRYGEAGPMTEKTRQLVEVAVMAHTGSEGGTRDHVGLALDAGASADEIRQAVLLVLGPAGMSRTSEGLAWANDVIAARRQ